MLTASCRVVLHCYWNHLISGQYFNPLIEDLKVAIFIVGVSVWVIRVQTESALQWVEAVLVDLFNRS